MASWPEGDGAGMCTGSFWPDVLDSAQVVGGRLSPWGSREFWQRPLRWVCHRGRPDVTPVEPTGIRSCRIPGGLQRPFLAPRTVDNTRATLPAGFSPARGVINVPPPAPVRVCVCGLVSGVLCQMLILSCDAWRDLGHTRSRGRRTVNVVERGCSTLVRLVALL